MKKIIVSIIIICAFLYIPNYSHSTNTGQTENSGESKLTQDDIISSQKASLNIGGFINEAKKYTEDIFKDTDYNDLLNSAIKGDINNKAIGKSILGIMGNETIESIRTIGAIIVIIIIHSILKSISEGLENKSVAQITYYVQYILIVTLIMISFADIITMVKDSISNLVSFSNTLVPLLMTLILTTGNIVSANLLQPILLFIITFIGNFIINVIIPIVLVSTALSIVSKISDRIQIDKLAKFFKSSVIWILGVVLTLFVSLLSIEGSLSSSVDGITAKTTKAAVSSFIPVVGKILGDAVDTVIGCTSILKNAVGIVGVVVILGICVTPIIKLTLLTITYHIGAAVCQPIADGKIVKLLEQMGDTFKIFLAIMCSVSVMLIVGTTLVMKISNSGLMYR